MVGRSRGMTETNLSDGPNGRNYATPRPNKVITWPNGPNDGQVSNIAKVKLLNGQTRQDKIHKTAVFINRMIGL